MDRSVKTAKELSGGNKKKQNPSDRGEDESWSRRRGRNLAIAYLGFSLCLPSLDSLPPSLSSFGLDGLLTGGRDSNGRIGFALSNVVALLPTATAHCVLGARARGSVPLDGMCFFIFTIKKE